MEEALNSVNAEQAAVVESPEVAGEATATEEPAAAPEVAEPAPKQSPTDNAAFARMRRESEQAKQELEQAKAEAARLSQAVAKQYGYQGSPQDVADQLEATASGRPVEEIRATREALAARDTELARLRAENEQYKPLAVEKFKADLLSEVKTVYPDLKASSVDELGEDFAQLLVAGVNPATAYAAIKAKEQATTKPTPPQIGAVNAKPTGEAEFYTKAEVDRMSQAEISKNYEKIRKSMEKWK